MPPELAGVLWVNNDFPFTTAWRLNPIAATRVPAALAVQETEPRPQPERRGHARDPLLIGQLKER
ncbi:hypothetical protein [Streptomyces clavifer]|uniref:hypothetical protein n=1 Tax=Streptomyces clavifer TaxID=68188 RepID=UPI0036487CBB